ncbi:amidohydrolase [Defluviimonas salinarum]|uniref:Amidohydrolase n=1 Tax=Defluviimonas salinarum TaxID=2992147 RepID=A0ABT3J7F3_9RHOB|nr:amidohydrolase [Defluviimonas salinarum]MCW3783616.1 amidohydrolase [Defluviimonas salinarum]
MRADLIITNARVLTMDPACPRTEALAIHGNRILALGSVADIAALRGTNTRILDARGATATPGLIESHLHLFMGAASLERLNLSGAESFEAVAERIRVFAATRPQDALIHVEGGSYAMFGGAVIDRHALDHILPDRCLAIMDAGLHTAWANSCALSAVGLLRGGKVPFGSQVVIGQDGTATGELLEAGAFGPVLALGPTGGRDALGYTTGREPDPAPDGTARARDRVMLLNGMTHCATYGFTSVHNMDGNLYTLELCREIDVAGDFRLRVQSPFHMTSDKALADLAIAEEMHLTYCDDRVRSGRVKLFMDGVLDSHTAFMLNDYADKPGHRGAANFDFETWAKIAIEADARGLQLDLHCIGDAAVRRALDGIEIAIRENGPKRRRHRIEHAEHVDPADLPRFAELGVIACFQPTHYPGYILPADFILPRVQADRLGNGWAWSRLRTVSPAMPFSSDWPVAPLDPMVTFHAGMTRPRLREDHADDRQTLMQMIAGYTCDAAYAEGMEHVKGRLRPGYLADVTVFSQDLETLQPEDLLDVRAVLTVCDGKITHEG